MSKPDNWQEMVDRERADEYRKRCHELSEQFRTARQEERDARHRAKLAKKRSLTLRADLLFAIHADATAPNSEDSLAFAQRIDGISRELEEAQDEEREASEEASLAAARAATTQELLKRITTTFLSPLRAAEAASGKKRRRSKIEETLPNGDSVGRAETDDSKKEGER